MWETFPDLRSTEFERQYRRCMELRIPVLFEAPFKRRSYSVRAYPSPGGMVIYAVDITERRDAESELRMKQEHLLLTQRAAQIGTWELDVENELLIVSPEFAEIAGLAPHTSRISYAEFLRLLFVSGDRKKTEEALQQALLRRTEQPPTPVERGSQSLPTLQL